MRTSDVDPSNADTKPSWIAHASRLRGRSRPPARSSVESGARCHLLLRERRSGQSETWYAHEPLDWSIVPVHHAQEFWDVRQWPAVHELLASLWGNEKLWVTMDRAVFKVPLSDAHPDYIDESVLHWDIDPRSPISSTYQGMLFLTDAARGQGSFECAPSIFRDLDRYLDAHPGPVLDVPIDLAGHGVVEVPARSGDLVIWSARLPELDQAAPGRCEGRVAPERALPAGRLRRHQPDPSSRAHIVAVATAAPDRGSRCR